MLPKNNALAALAALIIALFAPTAAATSVSGVLLNGTSSSAPAENESEAPAIETASSPQADDARIAARARAIFQEVPDLLAVQVRVAAGVVTLTGRVEDANAIEQAEAIAARLSGVVTVQNRLRRDTSVGRNINPALSSLTGAANGFLRLAPLIGIAVVVAILVGMLGYALARQKRLWQRIAPNPFLAELIAAAVRFAFVVGGIVLGLQIVGATALLGAVLGGAGVLGIAIGFAVRDTIDNYISSLMLSIRQPFRAGDNIRIDDAFEGRVVRLTSRATVLMTYDGNHLRIPNSTVFKAVILNFTRNPQRRFRFTITIDQGCDPCLARSVGVEALRGLEFVLEAPPPKAEVMELPGTNQVLQFFGWIDQGRADFNKSRTLAIEAVRAALHQHGMALPDTTYRIHVEQDGVPRQEPEVTKARRIAAPATAAPEDVAPEKHLDRMAAADEAHAEPGEDLLDPSRPSE